MSPLSPQPAASSSTWSDVLDNMLRSLDAAIAATDQRAGFLQSATTPAVTPSLEDQEWQQRLRLIDSHLAAAQDAEARAEGCCSAVEAELEVQVDQIERWQALSRNSARRLENVPPRSL
jgi:hypothetical protein